VSARLSRVLPASPAVDALARAGFLAQVPRAEVETLAGKSERRRFEPNERVFGELEPRETLIVVLSGRIKVVLCAGEPSEHVVAECGEGTPLGEVGLLTGRVASASAFACETTEVLLIPRDVVADLMVRFPQTAHAFAKVLAQRVRDTDAALARALGDEVAPPPTALRQAEAVTRHRTLPALAAAFRETLLQHSSELPFVFLTGFVTSLVVARVVVRLGDFSKASLADLYVLGLLTLIATGASAHFVFHRTARRILCAAYGAALGFLANELSVLLAFDVFYLDTQHKDKSFTDATAREAFKQLYERSPTRWAVLLVAAVAIQATYMRAFYRRAFFIVSMRVKRALTFRSS